MYVVQRKPVRDASCYHRTQSEEIGCMGGGRIHVSILAIDAQEVQADRKESRYNL